MLFKTTAEIKGFCGTLNSSTKFATLSGYVESAELKYIIPMIGQPLYDYINGLYNDSDPLSEKYTKLLTAIQRPLAFYTMLEAAPYLLMNVGDAGVNESTGGNVQQTRQWVYYRMEDKLASDAEQFLESLLTWLEIQDPLDFPLWTNSDAQKEARALIINSSATMAKAISFSHSRRGFLAFRPFIEQAETESIEDLLGSELFIIIKAQIKFNDLSDVNKKLVTKYLCPLLANLTLAKGLLFVSISVTSTGIRVLSDNDSIRQRLAATPEQLNGLVLRYTQEAERIKNLTIRFLEANPEDYPEYAYPIGDGETQGPIEPINYPDSPSFGF
jgi:hypothetical protein